MEKLKILIANKNTEAAAISCELKKLGYEICKTVSSGESAAAAAIEHSPDLVLMGIDLSGQIDGIEAAEQIASRSNIPVIFLAAETNERLLERIIEFNADGFISKPCKTDELNAAIRLAVKKRSNETAIKKTKQECEQAFDSVPDCIAILDNEKRIQRINIAAANKLGLAPGDAVGKHCYELFHGADAPPEGCPHSCSLSDGENHSVEICEGHLGGYYEISVSPIKDQSGDVIGAVHTARNISQRKTAEQKNHRSLKFLQTIIDGVSDSILVIGLDYRIQLMNRAARQSCGISPETPLQDLLCHKVSHDSDEPCKAPDHVCPLQDVIAAKKTLTVVHNHRFGAGAHIPMEISASPVLDENGAAIGIIEVGRDISARLKIEKARREISRQQYMQQKNKSIVTLAGGIAHQFNNALMGMMGNAELIQMKDNLEEDVAKGLEIIIKNGEKMAGLTKQLLAYSRGINYFSDKLNVNPCIANAVKETAETFGDDKIEISLNLSKDLWPIQADLHQITQLLNSVLTNAFESMAKEGGLLSVSTSNKWPKELAEFKLDKARSNREYIYINISDTGKGMSKEACDRIFEPFYSTKDLGRGLGMAAAKGIVENHGGFIRVVSKEGKGASVHIFFPHKNTEIEKKPMDKTPLKPTPFSVLVVDDDHQVLKFMEEIFTRRNCTVLTAETGLAAMETFKRHGQEINLVILDVKMPDIRGTEIYAYIKSLSPAVPVLITSGSDKETALGGMELAANDCFIQKPFNIQRLLAILNKQRPQLFP